ncbi:MAG: hypothetical protein NT010_12035 [Proteobacteria bacterium]|nr:hypothetical protein [Pseudomonadota bacterium]
MSETSVIDQLDKLLQSRYHGATNITGIRYQLLYSLFRSFDLYRDNPPDSIQLEGLEDIDVKGHRKIELGGLRILSQYVQVKTSKNAWDWDKFQASRIIENFYLIWQVEPASTLVVVTNFGFRGKLDEFVKFCNSQYKSLPTTITKDLHRILAKAGYYEIDVMKMSNQISFVRFSEEELLEATLASIVTHFNLTVPNTNLYLMVLLNKFLDMASRRETITVRDIENLRLFVQEQIEIGPTNLAIQNGSLEHLRFAEEEHPEDYYEGKNARPGHIMAGLDVHRPSWETLIEQILIRSRVCVVRASSGQGKSTLLYRYAYRHYHPETTFLVKVLDNENLIGPMKQAILSRKRLGLPILVLIDNLGTNLRLWHRLVSELAGQEVCFLITVREEDWYRYSGEAEGFVWEVITPELSISEAREIFDELRKRDKVAHGVTSAESAFDQIAGPNLLIEFVYLLTHGQMLAERLEGQVKEILRLGEDRNKLQVLRLISVAQMYGTRVKVEDILRFIDFDNDADAVLQSLEREYVVFEDGKCEGLHLVRSKHLVPLLHKLVPVSKTIENLISLLDLDSLESFIVNTITDQAISDSFLVNALAERFRGTNIEIINRVCAILFAASERKYYQTHQFLFDKAFEEIGSSGIFMLGTATLPFQTVDLLGTLKEIVGAENENLQTLSRLSERFVTRQWNERVERKFLMIILDSIHSEHVWSGFSHIGELLGWCQAIGLSAANIVGYITKLDWREKIFQADILSASNLLMALHKYAFEKYESLLKSDKLRLTSYFKLVSNTVKVEERNNDIYIEFIVDQESDMSKAHEEALNRLRLLRKFFPDYANYCTQGIYPAAYGTKMPVDDTTKAIPAETLILEDHAELNGIYLKMLDSCYSAQSPFEWQEQWFTTRREILNFVEKCITFYEELFRGKIRNIGPLDNGLRNAFIKARQIKKPPRSISERFNNEEKSLNDWIESVRNFLVQFSQHDPNDKNNKFNFLARLNFKDSVAKMPRLQEGFRKIISGTLQYFDFAELEKQENRSYVYLGEILDYRFEQPIHATANLPKAIVQFREQRYKTFAQAVRTTMGPLERQGFSFIYPKGFVSEHPLIGLALAFEVIDFERILDQILLMIPNLASFPLECHFVYLMPLLNGRRYTPMVFRISFSNIQDIAEGKLDGKEWALLPVEPPSTIFNVLESISRTSMVEVEMLSLFHDIRSRLIVVQNTLYFVVSNLDKDKPFESQLQQKYFRNIHGQITNIQSQASVFMTEVSEFSEYGTAKAQWTAFSQTCLDILNKSIEDTCNADHVMFKPVSTMQETTADRLFNAYLNAKYLMRDD